MLVAERGCSANALLNFLVAGEPLITPEVKRHIEPPRNTKSDTTGDTTGDTTSRSPKHWSDTTGDTTSDTKSDPPLVCASSPSLTSLTQSKNKNKGGLGDGKRDPFSVPIPSILDTPEFIEAFQLYESYRAERRIQKHKPIALKTQFSQCAAWARDYGINAVIGSIQKSVANNWQGLFEPPSLQNRVTKPNATYTKDDI